MNSLRFNLLQFNNNLSSHLFLLSKIKQIKKAGPNAQKMPKAVVLNKDIQVLV